MHSPKCIFRKKVFEKARMFKTLIHSFFHIYNTTLDSARLRYDFYFKLYIYIFFENCSFKRSDVSCNLLANV